MTHHNWTLDCGRLVINGEIQQNLGRDTDSHEQYIANNRLASAAPDLLKALKLARDELSIALAAFAVSTGGSVSTCKGPLVDALAAARAAITKAEGN